jgi:hypothetical protein
MSDEILVNDIPPPFWQKLREDEWQQVAETGYLNARLCRRLWRMMDRQGPPPKRLMVMLRREDVMREFPEFPKEK